MADSLRPSAPLAALCAALLIAVSPAAAGPFTAKGTQPGLAYPIDASGRCALCHDDFDAGSHHEPLPTWAGSMMANASRDPLFWAALDVANHDLPGIGDWCLRCHVPRGWLAGRSEPPGGSVDGCGLVGRIDARDNDFDGVNCHTCHRMMVNPAPPPGEAPAYLENGHIWLDDSDCDGRGEPCRRGPYAYTDGTVEAPHAWRYSPYHQESAFCGSCHNVTNPVRTLIEDGVDRGIGFPIERTHMEWAESDFAIPSGDFATCQGCHMPMASDSRPLFACSLEINDRNNDLRTHVFAGGNAWVPEVLRREYPGLFLDDAYRATREAALTMLQERSADVAVEAQGPRRPGEALAVTVTVTNRTGHKLPTGYAEGRRMWLDVEARDADGAAFWRSGDYDPANGVLVDDPQIKVYRAEQGIWNRNGTGTCDSADADGTPLFHFVLNNCVAIDNRIPPKGFRGGANPETRPVGYAYPETAPGSGVLVHFDRTPYVVPMPAAARPPFTIRATLRYQTTSREYVEFLLDQSDRHGFPDDCIARSDGPPQMTRAEILYDMWERYDRAPPVDMATAQAVVPNDADGDGVALPDDCDDADPDVRPGAAERCNLVDDDCDGTVDEDLAGVPCASGLPGVCATGVTACEGGAVVCRGAIPAAEVCANDVDDDCDGAVDEAGGCELCPPHLTVVDAAQTTRTTVRLKDGPDRDAVVAKGTFALSAADAIRPADEALMLYLEDGTGGYVLGTLPAGALTTTSNGRVSAFKDAFAPYEHAGIKRARLKTGGDGRTVRFLVDVRERNLRPFTGAAARVILRVGARCFVDPADVCTVSTRTVSCR